MTCPRCGNSDIRHSQTSRWSDVLYRALGRDAYRCRKCRRRFFLPGDLPIATHIKGQFEHSHKTSKRLEFIRRKLLVRRLIAIAVFVLMFSVFGLFLLQMTKDHSAANNSQGMDSSDQ